MKVRLLRIRYIDTNPKSELKEYAHKPSLAFILESDESFEKRTGTKEIITNQFYDREYKLDKKQYKKISFFNSWIGNGDWSAAQTGNIFYGKNIKFFAKDKVVYPVPFDFNGSREIRNRNYAMYYSKKYLND